MSSLMDLEWITVAYNNAMLLDYAITGQEFCLANHTPRPHLRASGRNAQGAGHVSGDRRLTKEQEAIRLRGLRILARMIVRAHLRSLIDQDAERNGSEPGDDIPVKGVDRAG